MDKSRCACYRTTAASANTHHPAAALPIAVLLFSKHTVSVAGDTGCDATAHCRSTLANVWQLKDLIITKSWPSWPSWHD